MGGVGGLKKWTKSIPISLSVILAKLAKKKLHFYYLTNRHIHQSQYLFLYYILVKKKKNSLLYLNIIFSLYKNK